MTDVKKRANEYFERAIDTLNRVDKDSIEKFVELMLETYNKNGTIYIFGNGGSGSTASHFCGDLVKGASYGLEKRFRAMCLNENLPAIIAIANDISYVEIFVEQLMNFLKKNDLVVAFSGSGDSLNVVKALEYAKSKGVKTVAFCGYKGGKAKEVADFALHADINDMEVSEDIHLIISHCVKRILTERLHNGDMKKTDQN